MAAIKYKVELAIVARTLPSQQLFNEVSHRGKPSVRTVQADFRALALTLKPVRGKQATSAGCCPGNGSDLKSCCGDTQDSNERARRSHAKRRAAMRASLPLRCNTSTVSRWIYKNMKDFGTVR